MSVFQTGWPVYIHERKSQGPGQRSKEEQVGKHIHMTGIRVNNSARFYIVE
jgi:hypothetical protein